MSVFKDEDGLKKFLKEEIKHIPYCKDIWVNKNLAREKFYSQGRKLFTKDPSEYLYPLAQPEIDFIVRDTNNKLLAIQVKYLKFETNYIFPNRPGPTYYEGIGQTLASLDFGFDCVSLWHCFDFVDGSGDIGGIQRYAEATHKLVTTLDLPINYYAVWIQRKKDIKEALYLPLPRSANNPWHELPPGLPPLHGKENPLRSISEVKKINKFLHLSLMIKAHEQKYQFSCIPSAIEMALKLLGKVDTSYYDLQNEWKNEINGSFSYFNGKIIKGLTFERKFAVPRNSSFPMEELFRVIDNELASDRYVIISPFRENRETEEKGWHMYVIFAKTDDDYLAFSKRGKKTVYLNTVKTRVREMQGTDILVYETSQIKPKRINKMKRGG